MSDYALKKMIGTMEQMIDQFNPKNSDVYKYAMKMVREDGLALEFVPSRIVDRELCLVAVKQNWQAVEFVPGWCRRREIYEEAVKQDIDAFFDTPSGMRSPKLLEIVFGKSPEFLKYIEKIDRDKETCLLAVKVDGLTLEFVPEEVKDKEVCLTAVKNTKAALPYVPEQFRDEISKLVEDEQKM